jgi:hypothetical protein
VGFKFSGNAEQNGGRMTVTFQTCARLGADGSYEFLQLAAPATYKVSARQTARDRGLSDTAGAIGTSS